MRRPGDFRDLLEHSTDSQAATTPTTCSTPRPYLTTRWLCAPGRSDGALCVLTYDVHLMKGGRDVKVVTTSLPSPGLRRMSDGIRKPGSKVKYCTTAPTIRLWVLTVNAQTRSLGSSASAGQHGLRLIVALLPCCPVAFIAVKHWDDLGMVHESKHYSQSFQSSIMRQTA